MGSYAQVVRRLRRLARQGQSMPFAIEVDGRFVGQVTRQQHRPRAPRSSPRIGYWLDRAVAGRGIMPTAVAMVIDHCFTTAGLHRIEICIRPENSNSLRVVEKLGLHEVGYAPRFLHIDGDWRDHRIFAVTVEECPGGMLARLDRPEDRRSHESHQLFCDTPMRHPSHARDREPNLSVVDLSALIFVALAVAWAVYLIPKALKHHDEVVRSRSVERFSAHDARAGAPRARQRRDARLVVTPEPPGLTCPTVETKASSAAPDPAVVRRAPRPPSARRPGVVATCSARSCSPTPSSSGSAVAHVVVWPSVAVPAGLLVMWLVACRVMVKGERAAARPVTISVPVAPSTIPDEVARLEPRTRSRSSIELARRRRRADRRGRPAALPEGASSRSAPKALSPSAPKAPGTWCRPPCRPTSPSRPPCGVRSRRSTSTPPASGPRVATTTTAPSPARPRSPSGASPQGGRRAPRLRPARRRPARLS